MLEKWIYSVLVGLLLMVFGIILLNIEYELPLIANTAWLFFVVGLAIAGISAYAKIKHVM